MGGGIASLNSQVVTASYDLSALVGQHRTDGQASFAQSSLRLFEGHLQ
jgi:hypothetical protein